MPKRDGSEDVEHIDTSYSASNTLTSIVAPKGMKFNNIITLVPTNGTTVLAKNTSLTVGDDDGDTGNVGGTLTATWYNNGIKVTNLNDVLTSCEGPYTLTISAKNITANTIYEKPNTLNYSSASATYRFLSNEIKLCNIKPGSMHLYSSIDGLDNILFPNMGYNPAV